MNSFQYVAPGTNVFKATELDKTYLYTLLEVGHWYYASMNWQEFFGPYHSEQEANTNFQAYLNTVRQCPSCEE